MADVTVVGSGPNGLAAALTCARAGLSVRVIEAADEAGGGARTAEVLESGYWHDTCSSVHPMLVASPFLRWAGLEERVAFVAPAISFAHPLSGAPAAAAWRDLERTASGLGRDGPLWRSLMRPLLRRVDAMSAGTLDSPLHLSRNTPTLARLAVGASRSALGALRTEAGRALMAGVAAHAVGSARIPAALVGMTLAVHAHAGGWPIPLGGSQAITDALLAQLRSLRVEVVTGHRVESLAELEGRAILLSVTPAQFVELARGRLGLGGLRYRGFRHGPAVVKLDATLDGPIPWRDPVLAQAGTVHLGGTADQVRHVEREIAHGRMPRRPFVLLAQQSLFDPGRAPAGKHTLYAYAHVPHGYAGDAADAILSAIDEHAPGIRDLIRAQRVTTPAMLEAANPTYVGGDIAAGATTLRQLVARPTLSSRPWSTPIPGVYLCGASTAPGPAVHGMAGHRAALLALTQRFGIHPA